MCTSGGKGSVCASTCRGGGLLLAEGILSCCVAVYRTLARELFLLLLAETGVIWAVVRGACWPGEKIEGPRVEMQHRINSEYLCHCRRCCIYSCQV